MWAFRLRALRDADGEARVRGRRTLLTRWQRCCEASRICPRCRRLSRQLLGLIVQRCLVKDTEAAYRRHFRRALPAQRARVRNRQPPRAEPPPERDGSDYCRSPLPSRSWPVRSSGIAVWTFKGPQTPAAKLPAVRFSVPLAQGQQFTGVGRHLLALYARWHANGLCGQLPASTSGPCPTWK